MAHKKKHTAPVPPGNRQKSGPEDFEEQGAAKGQQGEVESHQAQDPKRRLGDYSGAGEHPLQQPGPLNDGV